MKKFLAAAFHITLFQVVLILTLAGIKYWIISIGLEARLQLPFVFIGIGAFLLLLTALGITEYLENQGDRVEGWVASRPNSRRRFWIGQFIHWGQVLPIALLYSLSLYMITSTSLSLFIAFLAGIILRNIFGYLTRNRDLQSEIFS